MAKIALLEVENFLELILCKILMTENHKFTTHVTSKLCQKYVMRLPCERLFHVKRRFQQSSSKLALDLSRYICPS